MNEVVASGETYDPENPHCKGTAPMCDIGPPTTTTPAPSPTTTTPEAPDTTTQKDRPDNDCTEAMEVFPYPGDCHKYYICLPTEQEDVFDITVSIRILLFENRFDNVS